MFMPYNPSPKKTPNPTNIWEYLNWSYVFAPAVLVEHHFRKLGKKKINPKKQIEIPSLHPVNILFLTKSLEETPSVINPTQLRGDSLGSVSRVFICLL